DARPNQLLLGLRQPQPSQLLALHLLLPPQHPHRAINSPAPVPAPAKPAIQPPAQSTARDTTATSTFEDMSESVTGSALQSSIDQMIVMGFESDEVLAAMRAGRNNPDRAVEYLMNGIPEHLLAEARDGAPSTDAPTSQAPASQTPSTAPSAPTVGRPASGGAGGPPLDLNLAALRNSPLIDQIRSMIQQNPALLQPLIQSLIQQNPGLAQALSSNPELLMQLLEGAGAGGEGIEGGDKEGPIPPGAQGINETPEERDAIDRLAALGFPRQAAIEAYFHCGKNEELAANYLFENGFD
ncbi:hypothetical protein FRC01_013784, partial [Tulasnella sp. 417]